MLLAEYGGTAGDARDVLRPAGTNSYILCAHYRQSQSSKKRKARLVGDCPRRTNGGGFLKNRRVVLRWVRINDHTNAISHLKDVRRDPSAVTGALTDRFVNLDVQHLIRHRLVNTKGNRP